MDSSGHVLCESCGKFLDSRSLERHLFVCSRQKHVAQKHCNQCGHCFVKDVSTHRCPFLPAMWALPKDHTTLRLPRNSDELFGILSNNNLLDRIKICRSGQLALPGIWPFAFLMSNTNKVALSRFQRVSSINPFKLLRSLVDEV